MKILYSLLSCAFVLSSVQSFARADEPSVKDWAQRRVEAGLVKPLAESEAKRSRFSRSRPPPRERRVRVTQPTATRDKSGREFVPFAIDVRFGSEWRRNDIVGCVYRGKDDIFVKSGAAYRPAAFLFGKNAPSVAGACEGAPARS